MAAKNGIGLFSDVHGNRRAFEAIIEIINRRQELDWLCLGDLVGWFFRPVQCVLMLKELVDHGLVAGVVPGNHDLMALDVFTDEPKRVDRMFATAFSAGMLAHCSEAETFLRSLHIHAITGETWIAAHHSPFGLPAGDRKPEAKNYGMLDEELPEYLDQWTNCQQEALLTGHGHIPAVYSIPTRLAVPSSDNVITWKMQRDDSQLTVPVEPDRRYWIRNGTVGGPYLDGVVAANWTEYHPGDRIVLHREHYDTSELVEDIQSHFHVMTHRDTWQKQKKLLEQVASQK